MNAFIIQTLRELGVPANLKGYEYLKMALELCLHDKTAVHGIIKYVYSEIAQKNGVTPSRVERALRHAIEVSWGRGNVDVIKKYFGYTVHSTQDKPTNANFIATVAEQIRMESEDCYK